MLYPPGIREICRLSILVMKHKLLLAVERSRWMGMLHQHYARNVCEIHSPPALLNMIGCNRWYKEPIARSRSFNLVYDPMILYPPESNLI